MILDATTKKLEILLGSAVTSNQLTFQCEWVDVTSSASTPGTNGGLTNGASAVDLVGVPGASTQRIINGINIYNADTVAATVTVRFNDNATTRVLKISTLAVGDTLSWSLPEAWEQIDSSGNTNASPHRTRYFLRTHRTGKIGSSRKSTRRTQADNRPLHVSHKDRNRTPHPRKTKGKITNPQAMARFLSLDGIDAGIAEDFDGNAEDIVSYILSKYGKENCDTIVGVIIQATERILEAEES